jgi:hypothetical protein
MPFPGSRRDPPLPACAFVSELVLVLRGRDGLVGRVAFVDGLQHLKLLGLELGATHDEVKGGGKN